MNRQAIYIKELDGLRFAAFLLIFIHHSNLEGIVVVQAIKSIGWLGVEIFFCLSAFLLVRLLLIEADGNGNIRITNYYIRRALRIWPLYFLYITFAIIFSFYLNSGHETEWSRILGLITFSDNVFTAINGFNPIYFTAHLWTISYEEQFYLILPFLFFWLNSSAPKTRIIIFLGFFAVGSFFRLLAISNGMTGPFIWVLPVTHFDSILMGILLAFYESRLIRVNGKVFGLSLLIAVAGIFWLPGTNTISYHLLIVYPLAGIASLSLLCLSLKNSKYWFNQFLSNKVISYLGKVSFGLYVFHILCIQFVDYILGIHLPILNFLLSLVITVIIASLSFMLIERRFLNIKQRF